MRGAAPRIAHLNFIDAPGVTRKLREQAAAAVELGLPIDFFLISSRFEDRNESGIRYRRRARPPFKGRFRFFAKLFWSEDLIGRYIDPSRYEYYVIRFNNSFLSQGRTYRLYGSRIVTEHHSDEIAEILLKSSLGRLALAFVSACRSRRALRRVAGIIAMTPEVLAVQMAKAGDKPSLVLPNGVSVPSREPPRRMVGAEEPLRVVFAAADFQPWQGLDRLLGALARYHGDRQIELNLAGSLDPGQKKLVGTLSGRKNVTVRVHGLIDAGKLGMLYDSCHIGVAGLAFDRIGMREACPLKVREYAARGLPFVHTHLDPDLPPAFPYALKLPWGEMPVDIDAIVRFAEDLYEAGSPSRALWEFARERLDWKPKLLKLYNFISSLESAPR